MFGDMAKQIQMVQKLMKDENFRAFMSHPKVQTVLKDPDFQAAMKTQDPQKITSHPKLAELKNDPELAQLLSKLDFKTLFS